MKYYLFVMIALLGISACSGPEKTGQGTTEEQAATPGTTASESADANEGKVNASPKDALEAFVAAVKAKDEDAVKAALSEKTNKMFALQTKTSGKSVLDLFNSGEFEAISKLPETRNEKIDGDKATLEAKDPDGDDWDEMPFVRENGSWKLAFADEEYDKNYEELSKKAEAASKDKGVKMPGSNSDSGGTSTKKPSN